MVRDMGRRDLRLVADHGRIIAGHRKAVRTEAPGALVNAVAPAVARSPVDEIAGGRGTPAPVRLTRRGRLVLTVTVTLLVAAISMVLAAWG